MKKNIEITKFIEEFEFNCSKVQKKKFNKGEQILSYSNDNNRQLCILLSGTACLTKYDYDGNKFITERFYDNSIFSNMFYDLNDDIEYVVEAKSKCEVLFFPYEYIYEKCKSNCSFHKRLIEIFPYLVISKISSLTLRINILSMKSTREKLLAYFKSLSEQYGKSFILPFSITELACFLAVDRSSMSRELAILKNQKIILQDRNKITLL